jgi:hypothetical protein
MSLDVVKNIENSEGNTYGAVIPLHSFTKWQDFPISQISHHGKLCCEIAREWLSSMDFSQLNSDSILSGPRWITARYKWGPTKWPIHWCEALYQSSLDCGAQSAVAQEIFKIRGVKSYRVQLVQQFSKDTTRQWSERWSADDASIFWIDENLIYHECCAILTKKSEIKIWDGSACCWVNPKQFNGYGAVRALRLFDQSDEKIAFVWGDHIIKANKWQSIKTNHV